MTDKTKEALKLALEALENRFKEKNIEWGQKDKAINAIREALAEQPAQQGPVAWMIWTHGPVLVFMNKDEANLEFDRLNHTYPAPTRMLVPLYTSPLAQRKPLTPEQVNRMAEAHAIDGDARHWFVVGLTDGEAAHGIKENT